MTAKPTDDMTETALTPQQSFEESIKERLRADIGGLIPDAALSEMVAKAIQTIFFNRTEQRTSSYYAHTTVIPSWFEKEVSELLDKKIRLEIDAYMTKQGEKLTDQIAKAIAAEAPKIMAAVFVKFMGPNNNGYNQDLSSVVMNILRTKGFNV